MKTKDFTTPTHHPYGMLSRYTNASEKESLLAWMLGVSIAAGKFGPISTRYEHSTLVQDKLLIKVAPLSYRLTTRAIGLLYSEYGTEVK